MKTTKLFAVQRNLDQTEGRGPMKTVYYTKDKNLGLKIVNSPIFYNKYGVQGCGPYEGGKYDVVEEDINIIESFDEFVSFEKDAEAKAALDKLTDREKELLGLR